MWMWTGDIEYTQVSPSYFEDVDITPDGPQRHYDYTLKQERYSCELTDADVDTNGIDNAIINNFKSARRFYSPTNVKIISTSSMGRDDSRP